MSSPLTTLVAADALEDGLERLADIRRMPLHQYVARLDETGARPVLYLDTDSSPEDLCWAMLEALQQLALGVDAPSARRMPHLHSVS